MLAFRLNRFRGGQDPTIQDGCLKEESESVTTSFVCSVHILTT